ncbi:MAG TPA: hypothetical protein DD383_00440 [Rikenellaceae bacterium]|nr:hypothetical protein [Rikenellaceae bacterium]
MTSQQIYEEAVAGVIRQRRFGKSLLSSTIHNYFAGDKEMFEGLEAG